MGRRKLEAPRYTLRRDGRGIFVVSWTGPTGNTRKRSCKTTKRSEAEAVFPIVVAEIERETPSDPVALALAKLRSKRR